MAGPAIRTLAAAALLASTGWAQTTPPGQEWPVPEIAAWKRPVRIEWQRSVDDALAVSKATGRPLLIAVNMDREAASEIFAAEKYRDAEFARLAAPAVAVIVSVDRHNARDHDDGGRRIPCPRFGGVTCGEHVANEPQAHARWFKDNRVAPRHIGVSPDGKELFDRFLDRDLSVVDAAFRTGFGPFAAKAASAPASAPAPEDLDARVASRDARDRAAVEDGYAKGDAATRKALLEAAVAATSAEPYDLIRLGLRDPDPSLRSLARRALIATATTSGVPLLAETLRATKEPADRSLLAAALARLGTADARARMLAQVEKALRAPSDRVDADAWTAALKSKTGAGADADGPGDPDAIEQRLNDLTRRAAADASDGKVRLELAQETLRFAEQQLRAGKNPSLLLEDARRAAADAEKSGAAPAAAKAVRACAGYWLGDLEAAGKLAAEAVPSFLERARTHRAAELLRVLARANAKAIADAVNESREWPAALLTDAHAAFHVLASHPEASADDAARHADLLTLVGATDVAGQALDAAIRKHPDSEPLHARLRAQVMRDGGVEGLEQAYGSLVASSPEPSLLWFAGYASIVAAESSKRAANDEAALAAYGRAVERFEKSAEAKADYRATADHYVALALAGRARIQVELSNLDAAAADLAAAVARKPEIVDVEDGLERSPRVTLGFLRARLAGKPDVKAKLEEAIAKAAPDLAEK